jgi:hypothetical protein
MPTGEKSVENSVKRNYIPVNGRRTGVLCNSVLFIAAVSVRQNQGIELNEQTSGALVDTRLPWNWRKS